MPGEAEFGHPTFRIDPSEFIALPHPELGALSRAESPCAWSRPDEAFTRLRDYVRSHNLRQPTPACWPPDNSTRAC
jgi:hypothetical protein